MNRKTTLVFIASALLLLFAAAAFGQSGSVQKPMTDKEASKLIADWPAISAWYKDRGKKLAAAQDGSIPSALFLEKDFKIFIEKRGWKLDRFSYVAGRTFYLLSVVVLEKNNPDAAKQFDDAIAQIEASDMSAADKKQSIDNLNAAKASMLAVPNGQDIDQGELKIARAHYDELMGLAEKTRGE